MYTIGEFLGDLENSILRYKIPAINVNEASAEDQLYRHIIDEFWSNYLSIMMM